MVLTIKSDMTNDEIIEAYIEELKRLHGEMYANATELFYGGKGWFYLRLPRKLRSGLFEKTVITQPIMKKDLLKQLEEMRAIKY